MASSPYSAFSSLPSNESLDDYLFAQGAGLSDPTCAGVIKRRKLLELVKRLGGTFGLGLPRILAVGSQSVGKSSLIEKISGITLPRDRGTCTRCPIECHMSTSPTPWRAVVSIRRIVDRDGRRLDQPSLVPFGPPIDNRVDVEMRIRQAQQALLDPDADMEMFLQPRGASRASPLRFTRNSIVVEIKGPGVDDLAFVDLPGVIVSVGPDGVESDIAEVEELVCDFIRDPHCLILLAISCETDPENQRARQLVRQFDQTGERTIPVLTKPDRIEPGDEGKWLDMLRNRTERFKHGWFCVRQPGFDQLRDRITPEQARENELQFFETTRPWSHTEPELRARLGTKALSKALGQKLFEVIARRLPEVESELHRSLKDIHTALDALQYKVPSDPLIEVHALLSQFQIRIHDTVVKGTSSDPTRMIQTANKEYSQFIEDIGRMTPRFRPWPRSGSSTHDPFPEYPDKLGPREVAEDKLQSHIVYLDEISTRLRDGVTRELPGNCPYQVKADIIREYINGWWVPSEDIVYCMDSNLRNQLSAIVYETFKNYIPGGLHARVGSTVDECLDELRDTCLHRIREAFDREKSITATLQVRRFEAYRDIYKQHYAVMYERYIASDDPLSTLGDMVGDFFEKKMEELGLGNGPERTSLPNRQDILEIVRMKNDPAGYQTSEALKIMAEVRSYYDLAMHRYTDTVPMILDQSLVLALEEALPRALNATLPISGPNATAECEALLRPSEDILAKRKELESQRALLEKARRELKSIWTVST